MNVCANFETVGGHETYSGGIGGPWEAATGKLMNARFSELCTGCQRCLPQCPVRIDIPWLNQNLRHRMNQADGASFSKSLFGSFTHSASEDRTTSLPSSSSPTITPSASGAHASYRWRMVRPTPRQARKVMADMLGVDPRRELPSFPKKTCEHLFREEPMPPTLPDRHTRVAMLADAFTNYGSPERGMAAVRVLRAIGVDVVLTPSIPDGRAALSQGVIDTARQQARALAKMSRSYLDDGRKIAVVEPSVLRLDCKRLLDDHDLITALAANSFELLQIVWDVALEQEIDLAQIFPAGKSHLGMKLFYHSHCQQRTCNAASQTIEVLRASGFDVATSCVECCGMAVGEDLFAQVRQCEADGTARVLVASGTSCHEQLLAGMGRIALHPTEVLRSTL